MHPRAVRTARVEGRFPEVEDDLNGELLRFWMGAIGRQITEGRDDSHSLPMICDTEVQLLLDS